MDIMNFDKALNILGLTRNYTEEDLKKAYRKLMIKYHPDKWIGKSEAEKKMAEEKAKEINAAKDFLENYKSQRNNTYSSNNNHYGRSAYNYVIFMQIKESFIKELNNYSKELREMLYKTNPIILNKKVEVLLKLINQYSFTLINIKNTADLNKKMLEYRNKVYKELEKFAIEYCQKYSINTDKSKLEKYSLKKLYEELETIRKQTYQQDNILDTIEEEFMLYAGYNVIKENIREIKKQILKEYKEGLYTEEEAKKKFGTKVLLEFKEYYRRLEVINHFKNLGYKDKEIRAVIALMEENITVDKITFNAYEKTLTNFIAEKETKKSTTKTFNIYKEHPKYNNNYKLKKDYYIKHRESEELKYKIKKK